MTTILKLNRGSNGTLDLNDGVHYALLKGWRPRVTRRRNSQLGGRNPFAEVDEAIPLRVFSTISAADALTHLEKLVLALEQAANWYAGGNVDPVLLEYRPEGSSLTSPAQAAVLGSPAQANELLELPVGYNELLQAWEINPVTLPLTRRGEWQGALQNSIVGVGTYVMEIISSAFVSGMDLPTPVRLEFAESVQGYTVANGYILTADAAAKLQIAEAEALTGVGGFGGSWAVVADSANRARGGSVHRYTAASAGNEGTLSGMSVTVPDRRVGILAAVRNNANVNWLLTARISGPGMSGFRLRTVVVDNSTTNPRVVFLGLASSFQGVQQVDILVRPDDATGSPTLDFDWVTVIGMEAESSRILAYSPVIEGTTGLTSGFVLVDPGELTSPTPFVGAGDSSGARRPSQRYAGDPYVLSLGSNIAVLMLLQNGSNWRLYNTAVVQHTLTARRRVGYITVK